MKTKYKLLFLLHLMLCHVCSSQSTVEINGIKLTMPNHYNTEIDSSFKHKTSHYFKSIINGEIYQLNVREFKNNMYHSDSLKNIEFDLDYSQKHLNEFQENTLFETRHKSIKGFPGKEYRLRNSYKKSIHFRRVYIIQNNIVEISYTGPDSELYDKKIMQFLNSLELPGIENNNPSYLNYPSEEELKIRPYESILKTDSEQRVEVLELKDEKNAVVISCEEFDPSSSEGLKALCVMYSDFSTKLTDEEKTYYFKNYIRQQSMRYNNFTLIEENDHDNWKSFKFHYTFGQDVVFEERRLNFEQRRVYFLSGIHVNSERSPTKLSEFYESFRIK